MRAQRPFPDLDGDFKTLARPPMLCAEVRLYSEVIKKNRDARRGMQQGRARPGPVLSHAGCKGGGRLGVSAHVSVGLFIHVLKGGWGFMGLTTAVG